MIKLIIADDHLVVREGLKQILRTSPEFQVVAEASNGMEALEKARSVECNVIILDITMPLKNGLEVLKDVKIEKPEAGILILSIHPEERFALRVLKAGASGYLTKASAAEELIQAIHDISIGKRYITKALAEKLAFDKIEDRDRPLHERLSDREYEVMVMISEGKSLKKIASTLFISSKTVSTYKYRILKKLNMDSDIELIRYCIEHELVD